MKDSHFYTNRRNNAQPKRFKKTTPRQRTHGVQRGTSDRTMPVEPVFVRIETRTIVLTTSKRTIVFSYRVGLVHSFLT